MRRIVATASLLFVLPLIVHAQDKQAVIRIKNESSLPLTAKLVGPTPKAAKLREGAIHTFHVQPGDYRLYYKFDVSPDSAYFLGTASFSALAGIDDGSAVSAKHDVNDGFGAYQRYQITPQQFDRPTGWPSEGVTIEERAGFTTISVLATVGELFLADREDERGYVTGIAKAFVNRRIPRDVLAPLRQQGFKPTFAWISGDKLPQKFSAPTLLISYEESEGRKFLTGPGVYIELRFSLYGRGDALSDPIWEETVGGTNDDQLRVNLLNQNASFRTNSLADLRRNLDLFGLELSQWKAKTLKGGD